MANRYWVNLSGTWSTTATANWSAFSALNFTASCVGTALTTTGSPALVAGMTVWSSTQVSLGTVVSGSGNNFIVTVGGTYSSQSMQAATIGAPVPTAADSVFFDQAQTYTVTCTGALTCLDITVSAGTVTFATGTTPTFAISGSMSLVTGTVWSTTGAITFNATTTGKTITTNGVSLSGAVVFNGVGGAWTLSSALTTSSSITLTNGTFNANNFNVTALTFNSATLVSNGLVLGNGTWTISASGAAWTVANPPNVTDISSSAISMSTLGSPGYSSSTPVGSGGSIYCAAVADCATGLNSNDLSASDWTFEAWINVSAFTAGVNGGQVIISKVIPVTAANQGELTFSLGTSGKLVVSVRPTTGAASSTYSSTGLVSLNTWTHVAACMTNSTSTIKMFIGGVLDTTITSATKGGGTTTTRYGIGQFANGFQPFAFSGLITQARVSNTARYSATFTPSTSPFTSDANTLLLVNQTDRGVVTSGSTGTITLTSATAKTFAGGSVQSYPTLNQGGAGALTITGSNVFSNITNTYSATGATSILFTAGSTNTFTNWNASGAVGNLLTIASVTAAIHTLSKASGTVTANYLSLTNSNATGGATWNATNSVNNGGNTGWNFAFPGNFFFMFN